MSKSFFQKLTSIFQKDNNCCCGEKTDANTIQILEGLGGKDNIKHLDACLTRLRVELHNLSKVKTAELKKYSSAVIEVQNGLQIVLGTQTQIVKEEMERLLK